MASEGSQADLLNKIDSLLTGKLEPITTRLNNIEQQLAEIKDPTERVDVLENLCKLQEKKCQQLQTKLNEAEVQNKKLQEELLQQEIYSRRKNVRIHGLSYQNHESLEDVVIKKLKEADVTITSQDIDRVHFIGNPKLGNRRPVIMRLLRWKDKQSILQVRDRLRQMNITIQEDYATEVNERRKMLLPIFFKALELYPAMNPKFYVDRINLGGKIFTVDNINSIQFPELLPERVFSPVKSKFSPLSNFYPAKMRSPHLFNEAKWEGKNIAGVTLQRVRQDLM